jgi:hypothetical protein
MKIEGVLHCQIFLLLNFLNENILCICLKNIRNLFFLNMLLMCFGIMLHLLVKCAFFSLSHYCFEINRCIYKVTFDLLFSFMTR